MLITLEGLDGSGKTTQFHRLNDWLANRGRDVLALREPGGTDIGEQIRSVVHDRANTGMDSRTELLLYCASRAQLCAERIGPHLADGGVVVCDRFLDSTLAYQGYGRGLPLDFLKSLLTFATRGIQPDLTIYFDIQAEQGLRRRKGGGEWNRLDAETIEFHQRVQHGYAQLIAAEPARWCVVDATLSVDQVTTRMLESLAGRLK
jgi:dTMP kinase